MERPAGSPDEQHAMSPHRGCERREQRATVLRREMQILDHHHGRAFRGERLGRACERGLRSVLRQRGRAGGRLLAAQQRRERSDERRTLRQPAPELRLDQPLQDAKPVTHRAVDLRYLGQEHTVTIALDTLGDWTALRTRLDAAHERAYGYAAREVDVQLLNLRLAVVFPLEPPRLPDLDRRGAASPPFETRKIYSMLAGDDLEYRVYQRQTLRAGDRIQGPAAIEESGTTTIIDTADTLSIENHGCLVIDVHAVGAMGGIGGSEHRSPR